jgi:hypothetical protein
MEIRTRLTTASKTSTVTYLPEPIVAMLETPNACTDLPSKQAI